MVRNSWILHDGQCYSSLKPTVAYEFSELDELVLAYATSIHKAQGFEYPVVIIPILIQHFVLLQRNLLYTDRSQSGRIRQREGILFTQFFYSM